MPFTSIADVKDKLAKADYLASDAPIDLEDVTVTTVDVPSEGRFVVAWAFRAPVSGA